MSDKQDKSPESDFSTIPDDFLSYFDSWSGRDLYCALVKCLSDPYYDSADEEPIEPDPLLPEAAEPDCQTIEYKPTGDFETDLIAKLLAKRDNEIYLAWCGFDRMVEKRLRKCFANSKNRKEFEAWYLEKYGKKYEWKYIDISIDDIDNEDEK